jgi:uncharacterized protein (DUF342 family)
VIRDKDFVIVYHKGWAMLRVSPEELQTRKVYVEDVSNRMKLLSITRVRKKLIQEILDRASGQDEPLAPWPEGKQYSARVDITLTEDQLEAHAFVHPPRPGGEELTMDMLHQALEEALVLHGLELKQMETMVQQGLYNRRLLIAQGKLPVQGQAGRVKYHFITEKKPFKELRYRRIDLKELNFIQNRKAGDLLAELVLPVAPQDGIRVTGEVISAQPAGPDEKLIPGDNVRLEDNKIFAVLDGNACLKSRKVTIEPLLSLQNVDYSNGNIDFDGSVVIKGTIADGFEVKATGDIEVGKCIGRVKIHAQGSLMLKSGVNGDKEAMIFCGGDCWSRYIEGAELICRGNLLVLESVMHSRLSVWGNVMLVGGRAELMGGSLLVQGSLWCRKLGGLYEPPTSVIIGVSPELLQQYTKLLQQIKMKAKLLDSADLSVADLKKHPQGFRDSQDKALDYYEDQVRQLSQELGLLNKKSHQLKEEALPREGSLLVVEDRIYGGVHLSFGFQEYPIGNNGAKQLVLRCIQGVLKERGFNPTDPPDLD